MADHHEDYTREQLVRLLLERDKRYCTTQDGVVTNCESPPYG